MRLPGAQVTEAPLVSVIEPVRRCVRVQVQVPYRVRAKLLYSAQGQCPTLTLIDPIPPSIPASALKPDTSPPLETVN